MSRIRSIDGIRAISIIMVLLGHAKDTMPATWTNNYPFYIISNSSLGVRVFFVISGYLITKLLMLEKEKTGIVSIKNFYMRRIFRIFPIFYLYIFIIIVLKNSFVEDIVSNYSLVLFAALYLWNYKHLFPYNEIAEDKGNWFLGHFWSLSMEEQFYILWPITFKRFNTEKLIKTICLLIIVMPVIRISTYILMPNSRGQMSMMLQTGGDSILIGCLGALLENKITNNWKRFKIIKNSYLIMFVALFLFVIDRILVEKFKGGYSLPIGISLDNICILILVFWCIHVPTKFSNFLNNKIFSQIGMLSYSLYIWQQLFLTRLESFWVNKFPQNLLIVFLVGMFSYYCLEKPVLNLKSKFKSI